MIKTETVTINNTEFTHTYSDAGFYIERDNVQYVEAYDPATFARTYTETNTPVDGGEDTDDNEYIEAAKILLGEVSNDE